MLKTELAGIGTAAYFESEYGDRSPDFYAAILAQVINLDAPGQFSTWGVASASSPSLPQNGTSTCLGLMGRRRP
jgi:hypothetical protein